MAGAQRPHPCDPTVAAVLDERALGAADVAGVYYDEIRRNDRQAAVVVGYDAYLRLHTCRKGYLVVSMNRACGVRQVYTRLPCMVPGVSPY